MNPFKIGDRVKQKSGNRIDGVVRYLSCTGASGPMSIRICDRKICNHDPQVVCWIVWPNDSKVYAYSYEEMEYDAAQSQTSENKDTHVAKTKDEAIDAIKPVEKDTSVDWDLYHGFSRIVQDRAGNLRRIDSRVSGEKQTTKSIEDLDYDAYNHAGITRKKKS